MNFHFGTSRSSESLSPFVCELFYAKGKINYKYDKILPNGKVVLVINLGRPHKIGKLSVVDKNMLCTFGWLSGVQTSPVYNYPLDGTHVLGCIFNPLGFHRLFGISLKDWVDRNEPLEDFLGEDELQGLIRSLRKQDDEISLFHTVNNWLEHRIKSSIAVPDWLQRGYREMVESNGRISLEKLYMQLSVSGRHFNNAFQKGVGPVPKVFCRVLRLSNLLPDLDPSGEASLTDVAACHGFTDQPHFNREFKHFSGLSPKEYFRQRRAGFGSVKKGQDPLFVPLNN